MSRSAFEKLDDESLAAACMEPVIEAYKENGIGPEDFQSELYRRLTPGQQALFFFRIYYGHIVNSPDDFHWWSSYFLPQTNLWTGIKRSLRYFGDRELVGILEDAEAAIKRKFHPRSLEDFEISSTDIYTDPELSVLFRQSYALFRQTAPSIIGRIAAYIRKNPRQFLELTGSL